MALTRQERDLRLLDYVGTYLYGGRWQSALADAVGVNPRTVRGWIEGRTNVTLPIWDKLDALVSKKSQRMPEIIKMLKNRIKEG